MGCYFYQTESLAVLNQEVVPPECIRFVRSIRTGALIYTAPSPPAERESAGSDASRPLMKAESKAASVARPKSVATAQPKSQPMKIEPKEEEEDAASEAELEQRAGSDAERWTAVTYTGRGIGFIECIPEVEVVDHIDLTDIEEESKTGRTLDPAENAAEKLDPGCHWCEQCWEQVIDGMLYCPTCCMQQEVENITDDVHNAQVETLVKSLEEKHQLVWKVRKLRGENAKRGPEARRRLCRNYLKRAQQFGWANIKARFEGDPQWQMRMMQNGETLETMEYADKIALSAGHKGDPAYKMTKQQRQESFQGKSMRRQVQAGGSDSRSTADIIRDAAGDRVQHKGKGKKRERDYEQTTWTSRSQTDSQWYDDRRRQGKGKGSWVSSSSSSTWWCN